ncbi:MAG TPA: hypothetical protein VNW92_04750 [Polyangiaceae bacterium]|jgi:hypothetical protein|nr:hypothetical protein [Polyangiaceae bacterium]
MSDPGDEKLDPSEVTAEPDDSLRSMLRGALREEGPAPDVLAGVQRKIRERSKGKFYADGWSTAKHPPLNTYLITSLLMLAVLGISYALLSPMVGSPEPVRNQPAPVQVIPGK